MHMERHVDFVDNMKVVVLGRLSDLLQASLNRLAYKKLLDLV